MVIPIHGVVIGPTVEHPDEHGPIVVMPAIISATLTRELCDAREEGPPP